MLEGYEWLIIGVIAIVVILWGPAKIPEFAKALGRAKGEFNKASKEFTEAATTGPNVPMVTTVAAPSLASSSTIKTRDEILLDTARRLGIPTEGKTREQISDEISMKIKLLAVD